MYSGWYAFLLYIVGFGTYLGSTLGSITLNSLLVAIYVPIYNTLNAATFAQIFLHTQIHIAIISAQIINICYNILKLVQIYYKLICYNISTN